MISIQNLTKKFDNYEAVSNLSLSIRPGCIYGLVGTNGAGKSTLLRTLCGIYRPFSGSAKLDEAEIFDNVLAKQRIVLVPDDLFFFPGATMQEMAAFYRSCYPSWSEEKYAQLCTAFPILSDKKIAGFSKGMKRQAALILALAREPDYLLLDEAFDGLDPVIRLATRKLIADEVSARGMTAVISSHNLRELEDLCDHVAILHNGSLLLTREMDDLKSGYCKIQAAFREPMEEPNFPGLDVLRLDRVGSVYTILVRGSEEQATGVFQQYCPLILDCIPLTLEEVFISEMEAVGYDYNHIIF